MWLCESYLVSCVCSSPLCRQAPFATQWMDCFIVFDGRPLGSSACPKHNSSHKATDDLILIEAASSSSSSTVEWRLICEIASPHSLLFMGMLQCLVFCPLILFGLANLGMEQRLSCASNEHLCHI